MQRNFDASSHHSIFMSQNFVGHTFIAELEVYSKSNYSALLSKSSTLSDLSLLIQSTPTAKVSNAEKKDRRMRHASNSMQCR